MYSSSKCGDAVRSKSTELQLVLHGGEKFAWIGSEDLRRRVVGLELVQAQNRLEKAAAFWSFEGRSSSFFRFEARGVVDGVVVGFWQQASFVHVLQKTCCPGSYVDVQQFEGELHGDGATLASTRTECVPRRDDDAVAMCTDQPKASKPFHV